MCRKQRKDRGLVGKKKKNRENGGNMGGVGGDFAARAKKEKVESFLNEWNALAFQASRATNPNETGITSGDDGDIRVYAALESPDGVEETGGEAVGGGKTSPTRRQKKNHAQEILPLSESGMCSGWSPFCVFFGFGGDCNPTHERGGVRTNRTETTHVVLS